MAEFDFVALDVKLSKGGIFYSNPERGFYSTQYPVGQGSLYGNTVYASSYDEATELVKRRGLRERIWDQVPSSTRSYEPASTILIQARNQRSQKHFRFGLHCATFECMMAARAGQIDAVSCINDDGIVHDLIHVLQTTAGDFGAVQDDQYTFEGPILDSCIEQLEELELNLPGYLSPRERESFNLRRHERRAEVSPGV